MKKMILYFCLALLVILLIAFLIKFFLITEGAWVCEDGAWIKRGNPKTQMPTQECIKSTKDCDIDTSIKDPVCGEDGKTYFYGEAEAECEKVKVLYRGECKELSATVCAMSDLSSKELCQKLMEQRIIFENYIKYNISTISPKKEVLGGKFNVTKFVWADDNNGIVDYEDGHIAFKAKFNIEMDGNNPTIIFFEIISE